jgi:hypothetical protein
MEPDLSKICINRPTRHPKYFIILVSTLDEHIVFVLFDRLEPILISLSTPNLLVYQISSSLKLLKIRVLIVYAGVTWAQPLLMKS